MSGSDWRQRVAVTALEAGSVQDALELARRLGLECLGEHPDDWRGIASHPLLLLLGREGLALAAACGSRMRPVQVDFGSAQLRHRLRGGAGRREELARAIGLPAARCLRVLDATAGWGRDSALLAGCGCEVLMLERHPLVAALLADGLRRAQASADPWLGALAARLASRCADGRAVMPELAGRVDVVLLDPMFPERRKSALVGKEMQLFHELVGDDPDAPQLLAAALACARHRVVVKRPLAAPALAGPAPTRVLRGRSTRFDIYALRRID